MSTSEHTLKGSHTDGHVRDAHDGALSQAACGIADEVIRMLHLLTRCDEVPDEVYYATIAADPQARAVKPADISDDTDERRQALLNEPTRERLNVENSKARKAHSGPMIGRSPVPRQPNSGQTLPLPNQSPTKWESSTASADVTGLAAMCSLPNPSCS